jgi:hypothetical protein
MRGTYRASFLELLARSEAFFLHAKCTNSVMITTTIEIQRIGKKWAGPR